MEKRTRQEQRSKIDAVRIQLQRSRLCSTDLWDGTVLSAWLEKELGVPKKTQPPGGAIFSDLIARFAVDAFYFYISLHDRFYRLGPPDSPSSEVLKVGHVDRKGGKWDNSGVE